MHYYNTHDKQQYTESYCDRRGLLHSDIDLAALGIYPLAESKPLFNKDYQQLVNERVEGDTVQGFKLVWDVEYLPLEKIKQVKQQEIAAAHDAFLKEQSREYSEMERQTWDSQRAEAEALLADPQAAAPLVRAIANARGMDVLEMAQRIQENTQAWSLLAGHATGQRLAYQDQLEACTTPEKVVAITVDFALPEVEEVA